MSEDEEETTNNELNNELAMTRPVMKEELDMKDFKPIDKSDKNKLKFSYLVKFFQKFSELKGRKKTE